MKKHFAILTVLSINLFACNSGKETTTEIEKPSEWVQNATIYEVNVRQFTPEGTFTAFEAKLPQLKELGVDILWFMPIQPIGKLNRKAVGDTFVQDLPNPDYDRYWGSPYSISDYVAVNPKYGTVEDFKRIISKCHDMGIKVMLDWVGNHTAWDNAWITAHPEWYTHDSTGKITDPIGEDGKSWGWTDVADLNYDNKEMRAEMIKSMKFWVKECDLDGFRCDVAMEVPTDFWNEARAALETIKPMFMLAESEAHKPDQFEKAFDAYYGWEMHHVFNKLYKGEVTSGEIIKVVKNKDSINGTRAFPMNFITNHDENSWNGTINERLGESWRAMAVLSYALRGMPLIYNGQEAGLNHRLSFFGKDEIKWDSEQAKEYFSFYKGLNKIKSMPEMAINKPMNFPSQFQGKNTITIDRGANAEYRFVVNFGPDVLPNQEVKPVHGYTIEQSHNFDFTTGTLNKWGFLILKKLN